MKYLLILPFLGIFSRTWTQTTGDTSLLKRNLVLAMKYMSGPPATQNPTQAFALYTQCAEQGSAQAMNALGILCKTGVGTPLDVAQATKWFTKAGNVGYAKAWYNLGMIYKDTLDYTNAYNCFSKAASLNDPQSIYTKGYMLYKGFGCTQNYELAAQLFQEGAATGRINSMYFLGLCYRNGYGLPVDKDSAHYWLTRSASRGYKMASDELTAKDPENADLSGTLVERIEAAQQAMPPNGSHPLNQYAKVENSVPASNVTGTYKGYLLRYDWSGQHVVQTNQLRLVLHYTNDSLKGIWTEDDSVNIPLAGGLTSQALVFTGMKYRKLSHYNAVIPELLTFQNASLQLVRDKDSLYLTGNLQMFSPERNEPGKPMYVALVRTAMDSSSGTIGLSDTDSSSLTLGSFAAYPNPFTSTVTVGFTLKTSVRVATQLYTVDGRMVYSNAAGVLGEGSYTLPVQPGALAPGVYVLRFQYGNNIRTVKLVKQ
jgi:hypothetical protein